MQPEIPAQKTEAFRQALETLNESSTPYVIGGAFAMHFYSGIWRNTNDLDVYMEQKYVTKTIETLLRVGFRDLGELAAGDREWIYHATMNQVLLDIIWQPPNRLRPVDESFHARGREGTLFNMPVLFMPPDELIWAKIFILNRDRCDWPDIFHIVRACSENLDWRHLLHAMGEHWPILLSFIILYDWAYPSQTECIPEALRQELLGRKLQLPAAADFPTREAVLDPWIYTRPAQT